MYWRLPVSHGPLLLHTNSAMRSVATKSRISPMRPSLVMLPWRLCACGGALPRMKIESVPLKCSALESFYYYRSHSPEWSVLIVYAYAFTLIERCHEYSYEYSWPWDPLCAAVSSQPEWNNNINIWLPASCTFLSPPPPVVPVPCPAEHIFSWKLQRSYVGYPRVSRIESRIYWQTWHLSSFRLISLSGSVNIKVRVPDLGFCEEEEDFRLLTFADSRTRLLPIIFTNLYGVVHFWFECRKWSSKSTTIWFFASRRWRRPRGRCLLRWRPKKWRYELAKGIFWVAWHVT